MQGESKNIKNYMNFMMMMVAFTLIVVVLVKSGGSNKAHVSQDDLSYFSKSEPKNFSESINQSEKIKLNQYSYRKIKTKVEKIKIAELEKEVKELNDEMVEEKSKVKKYKEEIDKYKNELKEEKSRAEAKAKVKKEEVKISNENNSNKEVSKGSSGSGKIYSMVASHYSAHCPTCGQWGGITATGDDISNSIYVRGKRVVAVDPSVIKLGSTVRVTGSGHDFEALAIDTGSAIKGDRIDVLVNSTEEAYSLGMKNVKVEILK